MRNVFLIFISRLFALAIIFTCMSGCQGSLSVLSNGFVKESDRIPIYEEGNQDGSWQSYDLTLDYRYLTNKNAPKISGVINFADQFKNNFVIIKYFHLDAIFLDSQGKVLTVVGLISGTTLDPKDPISFSRQLRVPDHTASLAFSYTGDALTDGDDGGSSNSFWSYPIH